MAHADSDFANDWNKLNPNNASSLFSRIGHMMHCMGMPITWYSKLQLRVTLSQMEVEYAALSTCLRDMMLIMNLIAEIVKCAYVETLKPVTEYCLIRDNESCIKIAKTPILALRTKHVALEYYHFR